MSFLSGGQRTILEAILGEFDILLVGGGLKRFLGHKHCLDRQLMRG